SGDRLLHLVLDQGRVHPAGGFEELDAAWASYSSRIGRDPRGRAEAGEVFELVAPAPAAARAWVDSWASLVKTAARADIVQPQAELQAKLAAAIERGDIQESQRLLNKIRALGAVPSQPTLSIEDVRKLLRIETASIEADGRTVHLLLSPRHPLVLRQRLL